MVKWLNEMEFHVEKKRVPCQSSSGDAP